MIQTIQNIGIYEVILVSIEEEGVDRTAFRFSADLVKSSCRAENALERGILI